MDESVLAACSQIVFAPRSRIAEEAARKTTRPIIVRLILRFHPGLLGIQRVIQEALLDFGPFLRAEFGDVLEMGVSFKRHARALASMLRPM